MRSVVLACGVLVATLGPGRTAQAGGCVLSPGVVEEGDVITGTQLPDTIDCSAADHGHTILGLGGDDLILGSETAADLIVPGDGNDTLDGGDGPDDVVGFTDAVSAVTADPSGALDDGFGHDETGHYAGIENLTGSPHGDTLSGNGGANILLGKEGDDVLAGRWGVDLLHGGPGIDTVDFTRSAKRVVVDLGKGLARGEGPDTLVAIQNVFGSPFADIITGNDWVNRLDGGGGSDLLRGLKRADVLLGGPGPDSLVGGPGSDSLDGGTGRDACLEGVGSGPKTGCEVRAWGEALGVVLFEPTQGLIGVGFHESLFRTAAALRPHGRLRLNDNPAKFTPPAESTDGPRYVVMATRGRPTPATSSADLVVGSRSAVLSPVNGTIVRVRRYLLYCRSPDWQVVIRPDGRPDAVVMVLHITNIPVGRGDRVVAGVTRIGRSWSNDGPGAQENDYFPDGYPHVHIEIEHARSAPIPGCPL
ncbi:MAG TPA: calcium-binding protein [Actinomycetota bacterium]|nr:calcium-binding protein [Actinomycetota bacterium]